MKSKRSSVFGSVARDASSNKLIFQTIYVSPEFLSLPRIYRSFFFGRLFARALIQRSRTGLKL